MLQTIRLPRCDIKISSIGAIEQHLLLSAALYSPRLNHNTTKLFVFSLFIGQEGKCSRQGRRSPQSLVLKWLQNCHRPKWQAICDLMPPWRKCYNRRTPSEAPAAAGYTTPILYNAPLYDPKYIICDPSTLPYCRRRWSLNRLSIPSQHRDVYKSYSIVKMFIIQGWTYSIISFSRNSGFIIIKHNVLITLIIILPTYRFTERSVIFLGNLFYAYRQHNIWKTFLQNPSPEV